MQRLISVDVEQKHEIQIKKRKPKLMLQAFYFLIFFVCWNY